MQTSPPSPVLAALDLGTNNCRLLVARARNDGFVVLDSFSRIVRLGEGLAATGSLSDAAQARTVAALHACARIMRRHRVERARCVATEACRRAANGSAFLERAHEATGIAFEVLDPLEESRLALLGCLPLVDPAAEHVLVLDIGGGSTEFAWLERPAGGPGRLRSACSVPLGVVTLAEAFDGGDGPAFRAMADHVAGRFVALEDRERIGRAVAGRRVQMLGTSGTVTTLAALHLGLPRYDRRRVDGLTLRTPDLRRVTATLCAMSPAERKAHPCIGPGRADLVIAGCAILEAAQAVWPMPALRVADRGVREGILHLLAGRGLDTASDQAAVPA